MRNKKTSEGSEGSKVGGDKGAILKKGKQRRTH